ncbi:MAG: hypothetical protein ABI273_08020 [Lacunisphaera sp.]
MKLLINQSSLVVCRRLRWLALSCVFCLGSTVMHATTVIPPAFDELVHQADYVVHAVVKSVTCEWQSDGRNRHIMTKVELEVKEVIAGSPPSPLVLEMLGGKIGDLQMLVHGVPEFKVGDEDILFVHGNGSQLCPLVAMSHGRYPIKHNAKSGRAYMARANGESLYNEQQAARPMIAPGVNQEQAAAVLPLSPEAFISKIRFSRRNNPSQP